jgi:HAE1 family hydrophobic/amphiphilic exporter-1
VPTLFTIFQSLQERFTPIKFEGDEEHPDVTTELQQYAKRPVEYT